MDIHTTIFSTRDRAAVIEEQARALRQLAAEQARTVADKGAR